MNTEDRELLEMAAKAAGFEVAHTGEYDRVIWLIKPDSAEDCDGERPVFAWNPLIVDGDALRLAFWLGMYVDLGSCIVEFGEDNGLEWDGSDGDICHARRAIVRAAAEIGKAIP